MSEKTSFDYSSVSDSPQNSDDSPTTPASVQTNNCKKERIKVVVRIRPLVLKSSKRCLFALDDKTIVFEETGNNTKNFYETVKKLSKNNRHTYDTVFREDASQADVYKFTTKYLIDEVVSGYNGMVFAYGATGSGKTYTMMAMNYTKNGSKIDYSDCGIVIQALGDLFAVIQRQQKRYIVTLSYMEIYNENIKDLFNNESNFLELRGNNNVQIIGLTEVVVTSPQQAVTLLQKGNETRSVRYTGANNVSSRSHAILIIVLRQINEQQQEYDQLAKSTRQSKLLFVDLAGSERAKHTKNKGKRLQEGCHINKSLLALGNCISALSGGTRISHVNFRDSKLTRLLKEPLSGNYRTIMIAQVNPAIEYKEETKNTLTYATKAMGISKQVQRYAETISNYVPHYQNVIVELRDEVSRLKSKINERNFQNEIVFENSKAKQLKDRMIAIFEERMKLRRQLLDVDNQILLLKAEAEKHHQLIGYWQSKNNKLYRFKSSAVGTRSNKKPNIDETESDNRTLDDLNEALNSIENEQELYIRQRNEIQDELEKVKRDAETLENELHDNVNEEAEKELLTLFCRVHELEADKLTLEGERMMDAYELHRSEQFLARYQQQQQISDSIITKQRQLIDEQKIQMPSDLGSLYKQYQREIHITTMHGFKDIKSYDQIINFPPAKSLQNSHRKKIIEQLNGDLKNNSSSSFESNESESTGEKSPLRLPKVSSVSINDDNQIKSRSSNPSPIPAAVLFPPIIF